MQKQLQYRRKYQIHNRTLRITTGLKAAAILLLQKLRNIKEDLTGLRKIISLTEQNKDTKESLLLSPDIRFIRHSALNIPQRTHFVWKNNTRVLEYGLRYSVLINRQTSCLKNILEFEYKEKYILQDIESIADMLLHIYSGNKHRTT